MTTISICKNLYGSYAKPQKHNTMTNSSTMSLLVCSKKSMSMPAIPQNGQNFWNFCQSLPGQHFPAKEMHLERVLCNMIGRYFFKVFRKLPNTASNPSKKSQKFKEAEYSALLLETANLNLSAINTQQKMMSLIKTRSSLDCRMQISIEFCLWITLKKKGCLEY